jgi:phosphatidate cytidylyltransferase
MAEPVSMTSSRPRKAFDWKNLSIRAVSATVLIAAVLGVIFYGGAWGFLIMISIGVALLCNEWGGMSAPRAPGRAAVIVAAGVLPPVFLIYLLSLQPNPHLIVLAWLALAALAVMAAVCARLARLPARDVTYGVIYLAPPCMAMTWLRVMPHPISWTILVFAVTWSADICAFVVGNALKGPKLSPRYSPNKTWSGFFGGLVGAMIAAIMTGEVSTAKLGLTLAAVIGLAGGLATMAGDLWESMLKRHFGVKDSGDLIPGHGGLLDRVDGLMFAVLAIAAVRLAYQAGWGR